MRLCRGSTSLMCHGQYMVKERSGRSFRSYMQEFILLVSRAMYNTLDARRVTIEVIIITILSRNRKDIPGKVLRMLFPLNSINHGSLRAAYLEPTPPEPKASP